MWVISSRLPPRSKRINKAHFEIFGIENSNRSIGAIIRKKVHSALFVNIFARLSKILQGKAITKSGLYFVSFSRPPLSTLRPKPPIFPIPKIKLCIPQCANRNTIIRLQKFDEIFVESLRTKMPLFSIFLELFPSLFPPSFFEILLRKRKGFISVRNFVDPKVEPFSLS